MKEYQGNNHKSLEFQLIVQPVAQLKQEGLDRPI